MSEDENIDQVPKGNDIPEDVNDNNSQKTTIEQPKTESEKIWKYTTMASYIL